MLDRSAELLRLSGIGKIWPNGTVALSNLNLEVRRGEFLTLLGPSGCGKSTVLRMIAGLTTASDGIVDWNEAGLDRRRDIGFVFQEPTLMPWASVFDNVFMPLKLRGVSRREAAARVEAALGRVGLGEFAGARPRELSGGMKMRVSIARALVTEPKVLLMDEPFAALDEMTRFRLNQDLLALRDGRDLTIVFVTHSVYESVFLSDRIIVMAARPGRVIEEIAVPLPLPREPDLRTTLDYAELCRRASSALEGAMSPRDLL